MIRPESIDIDLCRPRFEQRKCQRCGATLRIGNADSICGPCDLHYTIMEAQVKGRVVAINKDVSGRRYAKSAKAK